MQTTEQVIVSSSFTRAMPIADVPANAKKAIDIDGKSILICNVNDKLYAVSNICSHAQEKLECGRLSRSWVSCPLHGARFELATGKAMNLPATQPIATYEVRIVDDWIEVLV
jgi:3-phenylpropionate/trans-cinnamate dioxygenase ferredoxin subunit